jgi:hypothetical protein
MNNQIQGLRFRIEELEGDIRMLSAIVLRLVDATYADILSGIDFSVLEKAGKDEESVEDADAEMDDERTKPNNLQAEPVDYITVFPDNYHRYTPTCMPNWIDDPASTNGQTSCGNCHHMSFCPHASMPNP